MSDRRYQHSQKWKGKGRQPARNRRPHPHPTRTSNHIAETSSSETAPSSRNNIESASSSSQPEANQPPDLPGFYYDPDKKRYFKILTARHGFKENPYSIDNIRNKARIQDEEKSHFIRPKKPSKVSGQRTRPIGKGELNLGSLTHLLRARELGMKECANFFACISDIAPDATENQCQGTEVNYGHDFRPPDEPPPKKLRLNYEDLSFHQYRNSIGYGGFKSGYADTNIFIRTVLDIRLRKVNYRPIDIPASPFVDLKAHPSSDYYFLATRHGGVRVIHPSIGTDSNFVIATPPQVPLLQTNKIISSISVTMMNHISYLMIIHQGEASHAGRMSVLKVGATLNDMTYVCDRDSVRESLYCSAINHNSATAVVGGTRRIHVFSNFLDAQSPVTSIRLKSDVFSAAFWDRGGGCGMSDYGILAGCRGMVAFSPHLLLVAHQFKPSDICVDGTIQLYDLRSSLRYPSLVIPQPHPPGSVSNILPADSGLCILANYNNGFTGLYDIRMSRRKRSSGNIVREYQRGKNYIVTTKLGLNGCSRSGAVICSGVAGDVNIYRDGNMESIWGRKIQRQGTEEVCVAIENYDHEDRRGWICVGSEGSAAFVGV